MLRKTLARVAARPTRAFSSSATARRVVATNPVKAEEVKVSITHMSSEHTRSYAACAQNWSSGKYPLIEHEYDAIVV